MNMLTRTLFSTAGHKRYFQPSMSTQSRPAAGSLPSSPLPLHAVVVVVPGDCEACSFSKKKKSAVSATAFHVYKTSRVHAGLLLGAQPWGLADLLANIVGCFVMGYFHLPADMGSRSYEQVQPALQRIRRWHTSNPSTVLCIRTGFCGALTTFSGW